MRESAKKRLIASTAKRRAQTDAKRANDDAFGKLLYFRMQVIRARLLAHGLEIESYLGPTLLALRPLETWLGRGNERETLTRCVQELHRPYVAAALANPFVRQFQTEGEIVKNPPVRVRFLEASVYGTIGECISATKHKTWGPLQSIDPVEPDFPFDGVHIMYVYHLESRYNRRFEQRAYLRRKLGRGRTRLVGMAMGRTQREFLKVCTDADRAAIAARLKLSPTKFWRAVKGKLFVERPPELVQLDLFA